MTARRTRQWVGSVERLPVIIDTGLLVALNNKKDDWHSACTAWIDSVRDRRLILPATVLGEVCHLIGKRQGPSVEAAFLRTLAEGEQFEMFARDRASLTRMVDLVEKYGDWPLGGTDASVVAAAEHCQTPHVATVDRRHFGAIVPRHVSCLTLHPPTEVR